MFKEILEFKNELLRREKSRATVEKYVRDVRAFLRYSKCEVTKESVMHFKAYLCEKYLPRSVNSMISSVNCFLEFIGKSDCKVKAVRLQRQTFTDSLASVSIPNSIGYGTFVECYSLTSIDVDKNNKNYTSVDGVLFNKAVTELIQYPIGSSREAYTIPNGVTSIGDYAFACCYSLTSVSIPSSAKSIGYSVFVECGNLSDIYYSGSEKDWSSILVVGLRESFLMAEHNNGYWTGVTIHFNSPAPANTISVYVNGAALSFDQAPVIIDGRTLVPLRAIFEALGAVVDWNNDTQTVTASKGGSVISLTIGSNELLVNGVLKELDVPASLINGRTMIPARAVAEAFGCTVEWDNDTRSVIIK